jgi:hypothetical protein
MPAILTHNDGCQLEARAPIVGNTRRQLAALVIPPCASNHMIKCGERCAVILAAIIWAAGQGECWVLVRLYNAPALLLDRHATRCVWGV